MFVLNISRRKMFENYAITIKKDKELTIKYFDTKTRALKDYESIEDGLVSLYTDNGKNWTLVKEKNTKISKYFERLCIKKSK